MANAEGSPEPLGVKQPQLLLYSYTYSFFGQKVVMALHEKGIKFNMRVINTTNNEQYQDWYLKINPRGEVPVLKHTLNENEEKIVPDSAKIISYLEENFNGEKYPSLIPTSEGPEIMEKHERFNKLICEPSLVILMLGSFYNTEFVGCPKLPFILPVRNIMKASYEKMAPKLRLVAETNKEAGEVLLAKAEEAERNGALVADKEAFKSVLDQVDDVLGEVESQLGTVQGTGKWLLCERFTAADISLTVLLERLNLLGLEGRFWGEGKKPKVADYYARVKARESYRKTMPTMMFHMKTLFRGFISMLF